MVAGLLVLGGGAVAASLAHSAGAVIAARAVMRIGAAVVMPATLSLLVAAHPRSPPSLWPPSSPGNCATRARC